MAMTTLRQAAIVLARLPEDQSAELLARLTPKQVEAVMIEMAQLGSITGDEERQAITTFADSSPMVMGGEAGGIELAKKLVQRALGKEGNDTLETVCQSIEALPFQFLQKVDGQHLLAFIIEEHPQTIALILSHLKPVQAAVILKDLPPEKQLQVVRRIATMGQTNPEVIQLVERGLERRVSSLTNQRLDSTGGVKAVALVLNVADRATERCVLENLAQESPELVEEIRRLMFVFPDLIKVSEKDLQTILKNVETSQWAMALKGASEDLKEKVMRNMSKRGADMLKEEMDYLGAVRMSAVEQTQQQIVDIVRRLEDAGELTLHANEEEEAMVQ